MQNASAQTIDDAFSCILEIWLNLRNCWCKRVVAQQRRRKIYIYIITGRRCTCFLFMVKLTNFVNMVLKFPKLKYSRLFLVFTARFVMIKCAVDKYFSIAYE